MSRFLETILVRHGSAPFLSWHQRRMRRTQQLHYPFASGELAAIPLPPHGIWRLRVIYGRRIEDHTLTPYRFTPKRLLKRVEASIQYRYKFAFRDELEALARGCGPEEDVLIIRDGYITDTTVANVAFWDGLRWYTPNEPLLRGTARERLIARGVLYPTAINAWELGRFSHVALMNGLSGFYIAGSVSGVIRRDIR